MSEAAMFKALFLRKNKAGRTAENHASKLWKTFLLLNKLYTSTATRAGKIAFNFSTTKSTSSFVL